MCGIAGVIENAAACDLADHVRRMAAALQHRGPDDLGVWSDGSAGIALAHARLSILDLSPAGHQPMSSSTSRYVIIFNGEVYNHGELRKELTVSGHAPIWRGHSDTEILLSCFDAWGIEETLPKLVGMFAFAVWDAAERQLVLVRDRMGEKPLYYGWQNGIFMFASEPAAFRVHPAFAGDIDRDALASLLKYNCIPGAQCIFKGFRKLLPGCLLRLPAESAKNKCSAVITAYWRLEDAVRSERKSPFAGSDAEAGEQLDKLLHEAVAGQMIADVPVGVMLSGGIDSSIVAAIMQSNSFHPVHTFTIDFEEKECSEAHYARAVARHLGTKHTELLVTEKEVLAVILELPRIYSEPFADSSQIPTFLVSRLASFQVKVALSGDGGDELFGGYNRYLYGLRSWRKLMRLPQPARSLIANILSGIPQQYWDELMAGVGRHLPSKWRLNALGIKAHKLAASLQLNSVKAYYKRMTMHWQDATHVVIGADDETIESRVAGDFPDVDSDEEWMMAMDAVTYLPDDILTKVDRAAMMVGLETRVPLLDHRLVEFAWSLPLHLRIRNGEGKWLLRQVLRNYVPCELIDRPKMGFGGPLGDWLRGPLRDWAEHLLDELRLRQEGYFNPAPIRQKWSEHLSGRGNWQYHIWDVLMFQAWLADQKGG